MFFVVSHLVTFSRLDFIDASDYALRRLADDCDPASFGRNSEAVLDEIYRKAGKLDAAHFSAVFDPERCGLMDQLRCLLLEGHNESTGVRSELYKLNVYGTSPIRDRMRCRRLTVLELGPGSFFKTHKGTPRSDDMFASLVVVLPTRHTGGALSFQHENQSLQFDSAQAIADSSTTSIAYAAFFSDIDYEVGVVQSGYRVTLTYNLYYTETSSPTKAISPLVKTSFEGYLKQSLQALRDDTSTLPDSGLLGFPLRHQYTSAALNDKGLLEGSDAILAKVCDELGLKSYMRIVYLDQYTDLSVLMKRQANIEAIVNKHLYDVLIFHWGGLLLDSYPEDGRRPDIIVHWVTDRRAENMKMSEKAYATLEYGNEPSVAHCYWYLCLIVEVNRGKDSAQIGMVGSDYEFSSDDDNGYDNYRWRQRR